MKERIQDYPLTLLVVILTLAALTWARHTGAI